MKTTVVLAVLLIGCAPAPTQQTVEIMPLPTHTASPLDTSPHPLHRPPQHASGPDRDGDGVSDDFDKCPDEPEDHDGFEDEDGCPDPDNDRDGILDVDDKCPNEPGPPPSGCPHP